MKIPEDFDPNDKVTAMMHRLVVSFGGGRKKVAKCLGQDSRGVILDFGWDGRRSRIWHCPVSHFLEHYSLL